ncbi:MAG: phosphoribosyl-AMP cyclohydrolase [Candidatus Omnitrophica bacterium]|nr:phosphoribosyl-AMP cyclohydrolase [Candidatus Omnitrophota bacterium]
MSKKTVFNDLKLNEKGLIPAIIQDYSTKDVLMLAYMNVESIKKTLKDRKTWFYSRSRDKFWLKGETSGNIQAVREIYLDCDNDTLLVKVDQKGSGACHTGDWSCFFKNVDLESGRFNDEDHS